MTRGTAFRWTCLACIIIFSVLSPGCADMQEVAAFRADVARMHETLDAETRHWEEQAAQTPADDPALPRLRAEAELARAREQLLSAGLARIDELLAEAANPTDPISETAQAAGPLLPPPLRAPVLLGAAALVTALRAWRLKSGLASVARGLAAAMREDEEFRACFARHADTFRATQTPTAKRVVDEVTGTKPLLALPV